MSDSIRGEYWIQGGSVEFADGDIGDFNHEAVVMQHAAILLSDELEMQLNDDESVCIRDVIQIANKRKLTPYQSQLLEVCKDNVDLRLYAMSKWHWYWVKGDNIGTQTFTKSDMSNIYSGLSEILEQEGIETEDSYYEVRIGVQSTGKFYTMTLEDLNEGRTPQRDF
jgi:hypothetical protein